MQVDFNRLQGTWLVTNTEKGNYSQVLAKCVCNFFFFFFFFFFLSFYPQLATSNDYQQVTTNYWLPTANCICYYQLAFSSLSICKLSACLYLKYFFRQQPPTTFNTTLNTAASVFASLLFTSPFGLALFSLIWHFSSNTFCTSASDLFDRDDNNNSHKLLVETSDKYTCDKYFTWHSTCTLIFLTNTV